MKKVKDITVIGFALFSMFFGAGNLIFPPYLGFSSGIRWPLGFLGYTLADVGLALIAMLAMSKYNGSINSMTSRAGKTPGLILSITIITCLGPLLAIPRTAATTFEVGIEPLFKGINGILFSFVFFAIVLILSIRPSKVIDIIGQILTPALLVSMLMLILKGIFSPIGNISTSPKLNNVFSNGIAQGYQTMDALGAIIFSSIVISSITSRGYKGDRQKSGIVLTSSLVAGIGLTAVYGGLAYLGATTSSSYPSGITQTALIVNITGSLLGYGGKIILGVIVSLACITTAIGLASASAHFYEILLNGKLGYRTIVTSICIFSAFISNFGVSAIIHLSAPLLSLVYPVTMVLAIMSLMGKYIHNSNSFKGAAYATLFVSLITLAGGYGLSIPYINHLPFANIGFNWIIPAFIGAVAGSLITPLENKQS